MLRLCASLQSLIVAFNSTCLVFVSIEYKIKTLLFSVSLQEEVDRAAALEFSTNINNTNNTNTSNNTNNDTDPLTVNNLQITIPTTLTHNMLSPVREMDTNSSLGSSTARFVLFIVFDLCCIVILYNE